jgi:NAD(P)-dependent dehydrogenase (short-subunit alcohol dehydrogenase family)
MMRERGWRVLGTVRRQKDADLLSGQYGIEPLFLELADPASIAACARDALELTGGNLYALFNNAAYGQVGAIEDVTPDDLRRQFEVNLFGTHDLTRRIIPAMRLRGRGRIVQCSSVLGLVSSRYRGAYAASKFALEALTDAMRQELEGTGIEVSLIEPGPIRSRFLERALENFQKTIEIETSPHRVAYRARLEQMNQGGRGRFKKEPEEVARKLCHAIESDRPKVRYFVTTPTYAADALRRLMPGRMLDRLVRNQ